jgi:hypothetical protein
MIDYDSFALDAVWLTEALSLDGGLTLSHHELKDALVVKLGNQERVFSNHDLQMDPNWRQTLVRALEEMQLANITEGVGR